jgi:hypothetical protein
MPAKKKAAAPAVDETKPAARIARALFDAGMPEVAVSEVTLDERGLTCTVGGLYDHIQRQGRNDDDLIALAVASYRTVSARIG